MSKIVTFAAAADIAQVVSAFAVAIAVGIAAYQLWLNKRATRARIVMDFLNVYFADKDMQDIMRVITSGETPSNLAEYHKFDKLLRHFNGLAYWWKAGYLAFDDLVIVDYQLRSLMNSRAMFDRLYNPADNPEEFGDDPSIPFLMELWSERNKRKIPPPSADKDK